MASVLRGPVQTSTTGATRAPIVSAAIIDAAAIVSRDARGRLTADARHAYRYDALDRLVAVYERAGGAPIARYTYNAFGERIGKTVFDGHGRVIEQRRFLYQNSKLVAEIDADGRVAQQFVYLNGQPVALLEPDRTLAIHTDHRGLPLAMTDERQRVVWHSRYKDAWGEVGLLQAPAIEPAGWRRVLYMASAGRRGDAARAPVRLNLRLPGQYLDAETGLHYNLHRYYDPRVDAGQGLQRVALDRRDTHGQGRYLTPDPLGYPDGPDPYLYASGDPVNKIDPLGLYEEDVHYYLTYFLALVAGLTEKQAWVVAMGNRYIDDNPYTEPFGTVGTNFAARRLYHFTQDGFDPAPLPSEVTIVPGHWITGPLGQEWVPEQRTYSAAYIDRRMRNPSNPQLDRLRGYAVNAPTPCAKAQFYGEYLHAFMDTFAHRDQSNTPYGATGGHLLGGHSPDRTYNHGAWQVNEARTLAMEQAVFAGLQSDFGRQATDAQGFPIAWRDIEATMVAFNQDRTQPDRNGSFDVNGSKIRLLNDKLAEWGLPEIPIYRRQEANECRLANLRDARGTPLSAAGYPGAILRTENGDTWSTPKCDKT